MRTRRHQSFFASQPNYQRMFSFALFSLITMLSGCTSLEVWLKMKTPLASIQITSASLTLRSGPGIVPGKTDQLVVAVTQPNGEVLRAAGLGDGKIMWNELVITSSVVTVNAHGKVSLTDDPRISDGKVGHITVTIPSHPDLRADLDIPIRYNTKFTVDFSGNRGTDGMSGSDGMDGSMGSSGSSDPNNPSAGGDGGNGTNGSDGHDGSNGSDAPPVDIRVAYRMNTKPLLQIEVIANKQRRFFLIEPNGGSLFVEANGGRAGSGGRGGRGGRGGMAGNGSPNGLSGSDGRNGSDGIDGHNGRGGLITITYDPDAKPYLDIIHLSNWNGPKPVFVESHIDPLW